MELYADRVFNIDSENAFKIGPHIAKVELQGNRVIKLNLGEPDFNLPICIKEEIKRQIDLNNTHYCDPKGLLSLREAIAQHFFKTRKLQISPDQVVIFPGAKPAIGFSQQVYCNPGDEIIYPSPGFPIYESFIRYIGGIPKPIHLKEEEGFILSKEALQNTISAKTKLIFLNFPSNPTGAIATLDQLQALSKVILNECNANVRVFSDEIYERILFDGEHHHSIAAIPGMSARTIISSGFSKTYAWTGGRVGYAIFPTSEEADTFKNLNINYFSCVPPYNQEAAKIGLLNPEAETEVQNMVHIFQNRRDSLMQALSSIPGMTIQKPKGAFYVFPNINIPAQKLGIMDALLTLPKEMQLKTSVSTLFQMFALYHHFVAVMDRRSFGKIGSEDEHYIRISCASDTSLLLEGANRLQQAFSDLTGFRQFMQKGPWY